ncbi:MAG: YHYH protein, partial [Pseudomonadales bacterium]|nr:YHYH protein [Pseudomonadales bacterium]
MTHPIWRSKLLPLASLSLLWSGSISAAEQVGSFAFLENNESFAVSDAQQLTIWGGSGSETLLISGTPVLQVDANIERIELPNALADYTFAIQGTQISIMSGTTTVVSLYGLNGDLTLVFADGAAPLRLSGLSTANLGDATLSTTAGNLSATLNTDITSTTADSGSGTSNLLYDSWVVNTENERAQHIASDSAQKVLVNIQSVTQVSDSTGDYAQVSATGIPDYVVSATQDLVSWLNNRPNASSDFIGGSTTISAGDIIQFGEDIGYDSSNPMSECGQNEGFGYWPPGPVCPEDTSKVGLFPESPEVNEADCDTGLDAIGYAVNGVSMYGWSDGQSYNSEGVWQALAPLAEVYDVDICGGHAANGDYHHHFYSDCWAETAG